APVDRELATEIAVAAGRPLEALGLAPAPPAPPPAVLPAKPSLPEITLDDRSELAVHAAADAMATTPAAVRPLLYAAVARAVGLGLTIEQLEESLRLRVAPPDDAKATRGARVRVATRP